MTGRRRVARAALAVLGAGLAVAVVTGCTSGTTSTAKAQLESDTQAVRDAAASGTYADLRAAVTTLKNLVASQLAAGQLSQQDARNIDDAAQAVLLAAKPRVRRTPTLSISPTTSSPLPTTSSPPPTTSSPPPTTSSPPPTSSSLLPPPTSASSSPPASSSSPVKP